MERGELLAEADADKQASRLAGAAKLESLLRSQMRRHLTSLALRRWALVVLGRPAGVSEAEADDLMGSHRESRKLAKQVIAIGLPSDCHRIAIGLPSDCHRIAIARVASSPSR